MIRFLSASLLTALMLGSAACSSSHSEGDGHGHSHDETQPHVEEAKGAHGGRLLKDGDFALEVTIFEHGVPPEFRLYPTQNGKPLAVNEVQATIELQRLSGVPGGTVQRLSFSPKADYLLGDASVYEPHSFTAKVKAQYQDRRHEWSYDSPEDATQIAADMAKAHGLATAIVGPGVLHESVALYGSIQPDAERVRAVTARFAGVVRSVAVQVGDTVRAGQTLASVESNESLQVYAVTAPIAGTVTQRHANPGERAGDGALFEVADFSRVRAELSVFPRDRARLQLQQAVQVSAVDGGVSGNGVLSYLSPGGAATQALAARVLLDNGSAQWTPGQFVDARVTVGEAPVALLVPLSALQKLRDNDVVFAVDGERYQALPLQLGRRDERHVEVLAGLTAGAHIVVANSYLVKADIEKSGASHDH